MEPFFGHIGSGVRKNKEICKETYTVKNSFQLLYWNLRSDDSFTTETLGWWELIYMSKGKVDIRMYTGGSRGGTTPYSLTAGSGLSIPPHTTYEVINDSENETAVWFTVSTGSRDVTDESYESD